MEVKYKLKGHQKQAKCLCFVIKIKPSMASCSLQVIKYMLIKYFQDSYLCNLFINFFLPHMCKQHYNISIEPIEADIAKFHEVTY